MSREKFMSQLETLLADVSEEERQEALSYYRSYFEDAGVENEERILKELESPEKVAATIKADLGMDTKDEAGVYTEHGFEDSRFEQKQEIEVREENVHQQKEPFISQTAREQDDFGRNDGGYQQTSNEGGGHTAYRGNYQQDSNEGDRRSTYSGRSTTEIILIVLIAVLTSPIWLGAVSGIAGGLLGIVIAAVCAAGSFYIAGGVMFGIGIGQMITGSVATGCALIGAGLLILALAVLATVLGVWLCGKLIPWLCRLAGRVWRSIFHGKEQRV